MMILPTKERITIMATHPSEARAQADTLPTATRLHSHWTQKELDQLRQLRATGCGDKAVALALHRSLYSVRAAAGVTVEKLVRATPAAARHTDPAWERGWTTLEDMGF
jgi:hypothetical protein